MNKVLVLRSQSGEWEGLFVDGNLEDEGHSLGEGDSYKYWIKAAHKYKITAEDIDIKEVCDDDEEYLDKWGSFPKTLKEMKGNYNE